MKLIITTVWNGTFCTVESTLPDKHDRMQSCVSQTQEFVFNLMSVVPTPAQILEHMEEFRIDDI